MFNRAAVYAQYPWLTQPQRHMIIGNDLDALLSAQFLQHALGWSVAGFYNYTTLYVVPRLDVRNCVWVDLDIYHSAIASLGHHILKTSALDQIPRHRLSVNPNLLRGIDQTDFSHKYPLGTIHFLLWLHAQRVKNARACTLLLWLADSAWINAQYYRDNVRTWLTDWLELPELLGTFDQTAALEFEIEMRAQILSKLDVAELASGDNVQRRSKHLGLGGHQCAWTSPADLPKIRRVTDLIERRFGWKALIFPSEFSALNGQRRSAGLPELVRRHGTFDQFLADEKVFSYVLPNFNRINYTTGLLPDM